MAILLAIVVVELIMIIVVQEVDIASAKTCRSIVGHTELALMIQAHATATKGSLPLPLVMLKYS